MSKSKKLKAPQLRFHKPTGRHSVRHRKKRVHLGADLGAAEPRYERWVADLVARVAEPKTVKRTASPTQIDQLHFRPSMTLPR